MPTLSRRCADRDCGQWWSRHAAREGETYLGSVKPQTHAPLPALVDLDVIDSNKRAAAWQGGARAYFPGLSVSNMCVRPDVGMIAGARFGAGHLWSILSPPLHVSYDPSGVTADRSQLFSLMLQLRGSTVARQDGRATVLRPGALCVIDSHRPFELAVEGVFSHFIVLQMPRRTVLGRNPSLERRTAETFDTQDGGTLLLRNLLLNTAESTPSLREEQRGCALASIIQMVGALQLDREARSDASGWRVRTALAYIDGCLADPDLTATRVANAQAVSRRRLDQIMVEATGAPLSSHIWLRRLDQAASDLRDAGFTARSVTQIAFAAGFESASHFTRAFKRRFKVPPRDWRNAIRLPVVDTPSIGARSARSPVARIAV